MAQKAMGTGMYCPNRQSMLCSQKHCSFWKHCEEEFGGRVLLSIGDFPIQIGNLPLPFFDFKS
jgi:hypothetical protein